MAMPKFVVAEMTLRAPGVRAADVIVGRPATFDAHPVPSATLAGFVRADKVPLDEGCSTVVVFRTMPASFLPEIRLPSPGRAPPMMLLWRH